jgi:hypothetical protein
MPDILQIATKRRNLLEIELTKLEEFLVMAGEMAKEYNPGPTLAKPSTPAKAPKPAMTERPRGASRVRVTG